MKEQTKQNAALAMAALAGLGLGGAGGIVLDNPETVVKEVIKEVPVEVVKEVPGPETIVYDVKEVLVESPELALVLDHIYDNDGSVEYLTEDLDDDEVSKIADRVIMVNDFKAVAANRVRMEGADELDKLEVVMPDNSTVKLDDSDIERMKVYDDDNDVVVDDIDFEDGDATLLVETRFRHEDQYFKAVFEVEFRDGSFDELSVISVQAD